MLNRMSEISGLLDETDAEHILLNNPEFQNIVEWVATVGQEEGFNPQQFPADQLEVQQQNMKYEPSYYDDINPPVITSTNDPGPLNFEVNIQSNHGTSKNQWIFSDKLNKLFVMMHPTSFPVEFTYNYSTTKNLFVRAQPQYSQPQFAGEMVVRCIQHCQPHEPNNMNISPIIYGHILRSQNKMATYHGDQETNQHFSVVVPLGLPPTGVNHVREMYTFMCKNSCPGNGMNRRPIDLIFTLEDEQGQIWGRKAYNVRICSCPKRDKDKEENDSKPKTSCQSISIRKRRRDKSPSIASVNGDSEIINLNLKVVGKGNAYNAIKMVHDLMAGEMIRKDHDEPYKSVIKELSAQMREYE